VRDRSREEYSLSSGHGELELFPFLPPPSFRSFRRLDRSLTSRFDFEGP